MFDNLVWRPDRLLIGDLVFRLQHNLSDDWDRGEECFIFYKVRRLVDQYARFFVGVDITRRTDNAYFRRYLHDGGLQQRVKSVWGVDQNDAEALRAIFAREFVAAGPLAQQRMTAIRRAA